MCSLVFLWVLNNWNKNYPKSRYVGYILLAGLPCLASVGEETPSIANLKFQGKRDTQGGPPAEFDGNKYWGSIVGGVDNNEGIVRVLKKKKKKKKKKVQQRKNGEKE